jgi:hypothetical protein
MLNDQVENEIARSNLENIVGCGTKFLSPLHVTIFLIGSCTLIKYAQGMDVYIYDFIEMIKMYRSKLYELYVDLKSSSSMRFLLHSIASWLENMMGCL